MKACLYPLIRLTFRLCLEIESIKVRVGVGVRQIQGYRRPIGGGDKLKGCMISVPADAVDSHGGGRFYAHEFEGHDRVTTVTVR